CIVQKKSYLCAMKLLAAILSIYLVALSTVTYCPECCMCDDELHTEHSGDCTDHCSPLCNMCAFFTVEDSVCIQVRPQEILAEISSCRIQLLASPFLGGVWQPPKFT
ncbi:MAG: hypothetical protein LBS42_06855, partial [Tannerella sp.]|nr:hypothetical protein [Tannerella sp.]